MNVQLRLAGGSKLVALVLAALAVTTAPALGQGSSSDGWAPARASLRARPRIDSYDEAVRPTAHYAPEPSRYADENTYFDTEPAFQQSVSPWQQRPMASNYRRRPALTSVARTLPFAEDEVVPAPIPGSKPGAEVYEGDYPSDMPYGPDMGYDDEGFEPWNAGPYGDGRCPMCGRSGEWYDVMACERFHPCSLLSWLNELSIFSGPQAFKNPVDLGRNGNFGFHAGANLGDVLWHRRGIGYQVGGQFVDTSLSGNQANGMINGDSRKQAFFTLGVFHRAFYGRGWQGGVVVDYLNDNYYTNSNLTQMRYELSIIGANGHEIGYWGAAGTQGLNQTFTNGGATANQRVRPLPINAFFYRKNFASGGQARLWGGFTGGMYGNTNTTRTAGVIGSDYRVPLSNQWDLVGGFNYIIPSQGGTSNQMAESFGLSASLVFYPGRCRDGVHNGPYRPLFDVANNYNFILDNQPQ
ncbi:MAG: hypothetical protein JSS27_00405 [Planctomycetes bacterium]|nr:hypothetical protein [Planctomycetota bacterium]